MMTRVPGRAVQTVAGQVEPQPGDADGAVLACRPDVALDFPFLGRGVGRVRVVRPGDVARDLQLAVRRNLRLVRGNRAGKEAEALAGGVEDRDFAVRERDADDMRRRALGTARSPAFGGGELLLDRREVRDDEPEAGADIVPVDAGVQACEGFLREVSALGEHLADGFVAQACELGFRVWRGWNLHERIEIGLRDGLDAQGRGRRGEVSVVGHFGRKGNGLLASVEEKAA